MPKYQVGFSLITTGITVEYPPNAINDLYKTKLKPRPPILVVMDDFKISKLDRFRFDFLKKI